MRQEPHGDPGAGGVGVGEPDSQPLLARESKLPRALSARYGKFRFLVFFVKVGRPFHAFPRSRRQRTSSLPSVFWACREGLPPTKKKRGDGLERRPPVGTAPRSGANGVRLSCAASAAGEGTPASPPGGSLQTGTAAQSAARRAMPDGAEQPDRGIALTIPRRIALWSAFPATGDASHSPRTARSRWWGVPSASSTRSSSTPSNPSPTSHSCTSGLAACTGATSLASRWKRVW